jgi:hypothetical protein
VRTKKERGPRRDFSQSVPRVGKTPTNCRRILPEIHERVRARARMRMARQQSAPGADRSAEKFSVARGVIKTGEEYHGSSAQEKENETEVKVGDHLP